MRDRAAAASDGQSSGTVLEDEIDTNKLLMDKNCHNKNVYGRN